MGKSDLIVVKAATGSGARTPSLTQTPGHMSCWANSSRPPDSWVLSEGVVGWWWWSFREDPSPPEPRTESPMPVFHLQRSGLRRHEWAERNNVFSELTVFPSFLDKDSFLYAKKKILSLWRILKTLRHSHLSSHQH